MKTIHEIIKRNGKEKGLKKGKIRIEKDSDAVLEIEHVGKGPRGYFAIKVTQYLKEGNEFQMNPQINFEVFGTGGWTMKEGKLEYEKGTTYIPYLYIQEGQSVRDEVFELDKEGKIRHTNQRLLECLKVICHLWDGIFEDQGYLNVFNPNSQALGESV